MKNFEELKTEAIKRGILPGAVIKCVADGITGTVADFDKWVMTIGMLYVGEDIKGGALCAFAEHTNTWATIITPSPTQQPDTLQPGDACECSEAMQVAIIEIAKSFGIKELAKLADVPKKGVRFTEGGSIFNYAYRNSENNFIDEWEFIRRLKNTAPMKMLGDHMYTIEDGHVIADGNKIPFEHVHKLNAEILNLK
jgi:hypothetical protein